MTDHENAPIYTEYPEPVQTIRTDYGVREWCGAKYAGFDGKMYWDLTCEKKVGHDSFHKDGQMLWLPDPDLSRAKP